MYCNGNSISHIPKYHFNEQPITIIIITMTKKTAPRIKPVAILFLLIA
jgi:hypothetical protein